MIATVLGSALGAALLSVQGSGPESFYNDPVLRSAAQGFSPEPAVDPDSAVETLFEASNPGSADIPDAAFAPEAPTPESR